MLGWDSVASIAVGMADSALLGDSMRAQAERSFTDALVNTSAAMKLLRRLLKGLELC